MNYFEVCERLTKLKQNQNDYWEVANELYNLCIKQYHALVRIKAYAEKNQLEKIEKIADEVLDGKI